MPHPFRPWMTHPHILLCSNFTLCECPIGAHICLLIHHRAKESHKLMPCDTLTDFVKRVSCLVWPEEDPSGSKQWSSFLHSKIAQIIHLRVSTPNVPTDGHLTISYAILHSHIPPLFQNYVNSEQFSPGLGPCHWAAEPYMRIPRWSSMNKQLA